MEHERLVHRRKWRCFAKEHKNVLYKSEHELSAHLTGDHVDLTAQHIAGILELAETTIADNRKECPFCLSKGPFEIDLCSHMASHQETLATFAAPRQDLENEAEETMAQSTGSNNAQGMRSAGSLRSITLSFSDGVPDKHEKLVMDDQDDHLLLESAGTEGDAPLLKHISDSTREPYTMNRRESIRNAARNGDVSVVKTLLDSGADSAESDVYASSALAIASLFDHEDLVHALLEPQSNRKINEHSLSSSLVSAVYNGHQSVLKILLEHGANPDTMVDAIYSDFSNLLAEKNNQEITEILLNIGADGLRVSSESAGFPGFYALEYAAIKGNASIIESLLNYGATLEAKGFRGMTALHWAITAGQEEAVKVLLRRGASQSRTQEGKTPFDLAWDKGHRGIINLLLKHEKNTNPTAAGSTKDMISQNTVEPVDNVKSPSHEQPMQDAVQDESSALRAPEITITPSPDLPIQDANQYSTWELWDVKHTDFQFEKPWKPNK
jgi:ankyrin repeat protein